MGWFVNGFAFLAVSEEIMRESPFYELIKERGARETYIKAILSILTRRFPQCDRDSVSVALDSILDIDRLTELFNNAIDTPSVEVFLEELDATET